MEYWQKRYLQERLAFPGLTAGLMTIDLPNKGLLGGLEFRILGLTGAAKDAPDMFIHDVLERVELIVNGSQVVKSLSGTQIRAINQYEKSFADLETMYSGNSEAQSECFYLSLGRYYHDDEYLLDLGRVNDPELRLHYNFTNPADDGWSNIQPFTGTPYISVIPHLLRESDKMPKGYIKTSEVYRHNGGATLKHNMRIPRGPVYCGLYLQCRYTLEGLSNCIDHIELNLDNDRIIPFRIDANDLRADIERKYGRFQELHLPYCTCGQEYPAPIECGDWTDTLIANTDCIGGEGVLWANSMTIGGMTSAAQVAAAGNFQRQFHFKGIYPYSVAKIPFFNLERPESWINSTELGDFWLRVEERDVARVGRVWKLLADEVITTYL